MSDANTNRLGEAAREFNDALGRTDGEQVLGSLGSGLDVLRDLLYTRVHEDVEQAFGADSMLIPLSEDRTARVTKLEIEIYQAVSSHAAAIEFGYLPQGDRRLLKSIAQLRIGDEVDNPNVAQRIESYLAQKPQDRRLAFMDALARAVPEARQAPLVLFRLYPRALSIVVATAFNDSSRAHRIRYEQEEILPQISGCEACHGQPLANGSQCERCGNPLWNYARLNLAE